MNMKCTTFCQKNGHPSIVPLKCKRKRKRTMMLYDIKDGNNDKSKEKALDREEWKKMQITH